MGRRILAIAVATVIALIGAVLVLVYARGADARAVEAASPRDVYVSTATIPAGTSLKEAVRLELALKTQTAASALPAGAITVVDDSNSELLALTDIPPGQYLLTRRSARLRSARRRSRCLPGSLPCRCSSATPPASATS